MTVLINGKTREVGEGTTLVELLAALGFSHQGLLVEHNGRALFAREFDNTSLKDGDKLELVRVAAGG
ncbi:MAG: sulfur carrier protein ThiS [Verrucomicrobiales bacterium]